jgi:small subunit ribosomal protein S1
LAFSHKIYSLSEGFLNILSNLSETFKELLNPQSYKLLISILLIDLIQNKKLELDDSSYDSKIKEALNSLEKGNYDNLDFLKFLKRFNYSFIDFDIDGETEALLNKFDEILTSSIQRTETEYQSLLQHFLLSFNKYFELLLFYQERSTEDKAKEYFIRFIGIIDELRNFFSSVLWYEEFLNYTPIQGRISSLTRSGFEVKIDQDLFASKISQKELKEELSTDFIQHFGFGFLHSSSLSGFPKAKKLFQTKHKSTQPKIPVNSAELEQIEDINDFFISKLSYSAFNKRNVLILSPFKDSILKIVAKYELKAFFYVLELFLIEKASVFLAVSSPFPRKEGTFKLLILPNYIDNYNIRFSEQTFWDILKSMRPFLYETLFVKHKDTEESIKKISNALDTGLPVEGFIKSRSKGGMVVTVFGIDGFLPGSHIDMRPVSNYDEYVGRTMEFKVVKINKRQNNFVVSHKLFLELEYNVQKEEFLSKLEIGQIVVGVVKNIVNYGVFVELTGCDGLIHKSDLSWDLNAYPEDVVKFNQKINVIVLDFDSDKKRISLGLKQLYQHPWDRLTPNLKVGDIIKGHIVVIYKFAFLVKMGNGIEGILPFSELSWNKKFNNTLQIGDEIEARIIRLDRSDCKLSLSIKQLLQDPWNIVLSKYKKGTKHNAIVKAVNKFGIFVELESGVEGMIHISNIVTLKRVKRLIDYTKVGYRIKVIILSIDTYKRRLGLKHIEEEKK